MKHKQPHPWRTQSALATGTLREVKDRNTHKPGENYGGLGEQINERAFGRRLRLGFAELNAGDDEKGTE